MTWLDEIEEGSRRAREALGRLPKMSNKESAYERMARVIRELTNHLEDTINWAKHAGLYLIDGVPGSDPILEQKRLTAAKSWDNLSPDVKELMEK